MMRAAEIKEVLMGVGENKYKAHGIGEIEQAAWKELDV
jgi:hypothetical protein